MSAEKSNSAKNNKLPKKSDKNTKGTSGSNTRESSTAVPTEKAGQTAKSGELISAGLWDLSQLKQLCDESGVSGDERRVGLLIASFIKPHCDKLFFDRTGNLIAFKKGRSTPKSPVMFCAHLDEVGFMIRHINDDGSLLFEQAGMMPEVLLSKRVLIGENKIPGVICSKPVHLTRGKEKEPPQTDNMYIDIGAQNAKQAKNLDVYAKYAAFDNAFTVLGDGTAVCSKAIDDRFGCQVMIRLLSSVPEYDSYFVFTVGEELGGTGALAAVRYIKPGIAVILESTTASDLPQNTGGNKVCSVGGGAVVPFMDGGTKYDERLVKRLWDIAAENGIRVQTKSRIAGGTDAAAIQRGLDGVRVCAVSLPCRYIHTSSCLASVSDMADCFNLVSLFAKEVGKLL